MNTYTFKSGRYEFIVNCKTETNGKFSCHIPAYDMYYSTGSVKMIEKKGKAMVEVWMNYYGIK
jgi:hypothetical protein